MITRAGSKGSTRLTMLETLRQYGLERLTEAGELNASLDRHPRYFRDLVQDKRAVLYSEREPEAWEVLGEDWDNIRAAFTHALDSQQPEVYGPLVAGVGSYGVFSARTEVGEWAAVAIQAGALGGRAEEVDIHGVHGMWAYWFNSDFDLARATTAGFCDSPRHDHYGSCQFAAFMAAAIGARDRDGADALSRAWLADREVTEVAAVLAHFVRGAYGLWFAISPWT